MDMAKEQGRGRETYKLVRLKRICKTVGSFLEDIFQQIHSNKKPAISGQKSSTVPRTKHDRALSCATDLSRNLFLDLGGRRERSQVVSSLLSRNPRLQLLLYQSYVSKALLKEDGELLSVLLQLRRSTS